MGIFITIINNLFCFNISNTLFDQRIDEEMAYKEFTIKNSSRESIRYKIKVLKPDGDYMDMSKWVRISPIVLNIKPLSEKVLKIFAKSPKNAKKGEYGFQIRIVPIMIPTIKKVKEGVIGGTSMVAITPVVQMYGYVGNADFKKNIKFENAKLKKDKTGYVLIGDLINDGFAGKNIGFSFIDNRGFIVKESWIGRVSPKFNQKLNIPIDEKFTQISIYDGETHKEIKRINILK